MIDEFVARRRQEQGLKPGSVVSPATINKDLKKQQEGQTDGQELGDGK